ncbi:MAG: tRNA-dihydrouridine synthase [Bacteroidales bacterium]|nr:tRNA-dihydrouridine synthase [Bacteroidales bacterium]
MKENFWKAYQPVFALAPMEDVTDTVFRELILELSNPEHLHVVMSEFTSTDGLCHEEGRHKVAQRLQVNESERRLLQEKGIKLVAQIWGTDPEKFYRSARMISNDMEFDGIDINMGCPVSKIIKHGSCSALINDPERAKAIIQATKEGSPGPVSVKTRTGFNEVVTESWMSNLIEAKPTAITLHGRTQKMQSKVPADWNEITRAVRVRDEMHVDIPVLGNGDVESLPEALEKVKQTGADGVMIGKGVFKNPALFNEGYPELTPKEKLDLLWKHTLLFTETWGETKNFAILRKYFKIYASGFSNASALRNSLMSTHSIDEVKEILEMFNINENRPEPSPVS